MSILLLQTCHAIDLAIKKPMSASNLNRAMGTQFGVSGVELNDLSQMINHAQVS